MDALDALKLQIEWGADEALTDAPVDRTRPAPAVAPPPDIAAKARPRVAAPSPAPVSPALSLLAPPVRRAEEIAAACATLDELRKALEMFEGCPLSTTATNLVFEDGNPASGLMFVGEAPGADEDRAGLPFVGVSGRFLDRMLASIGLDRSRFLITNMIPWRPPGNRNPTDTEVMTCLPFLLRHVALARPRRLVLLGALATKAITGRTDGIRRMRGRWLELTIPGLDSPLPTLPMLHPAYLLRTAGAKRDAWADLLSLRRALDADNAEVTQ